MQKNSACYRCYKYWLRYAIVVAVLIRSVSTGTLTEPQKAAARGVGEFSMSSQGPVSVYLTMTLAFTSVISTTFRVNLMWLLTEAEALTERDMTLHCRSQYTQRWLTKRCVSAIIQISAMNLKLLYASRNRGFSRRPCWRAETMKQFCMKIILFPRGQWRHMKMLYRNVLYIFPLKFCYCWLSGREEGARQGGRKVYMNHQFPRVPNL